MKDDKNLRILCCVCHFFGQNPLFTGKSSGLNPERRRAIIKSCIEQLKKLGNIDIKICGIDSYSLVDIDVAFPFIIHNPTLIVYECLSYLASKVKDYDYFICIEDDIFLPEETFRNVVEFDKHSLLNEILHPNRLEKDNDGAIKCIDTSVISLWTYQYRMYKNREIRVAHNPHSGLLIMERRKLEYTLSQIDNSYRGVFIGKAMESAFAHFHSPFLLYRFYQDLSFHHVLHMDNWIPDINMSKDSEKAGTKDTDIDKSVLMEKSRLQMKDFMPPVLYKAKAYVKKLLNY